MNDRPDLVLKKASSWAIAWSILLIGLGLIAVALPLVAALAVTTLVSWLLIIGGAFHLVMAVSSRGAGTLLWEVLVSLVYIIGGGYMLFHPLLGVATLTLLLAAFFFVEAIFDFVAFLGVRHQRGAGWMLVDGVVTLLLAGLIWAHWPSSSAWAIGTIIGISLLVSGFKWLMISLGARKIARSAGGTAVAA
ncbi:MAG TPA: HdeD family acid-resistance protein [Terriglobales bacterium]|nr:HdeD family acid-resistance protein [Terriglobales bacterium]